VRSQRRPVAPAEEAGLTTTMVRRVSCGVIYGYQFPAAGGEELCSGHAPIALHFEQRDGNCSRTHPALDPRQCAACMIGLAFSQAGRGAGAEPVHRCLPRYTWKRISESMTMSSGYKKSDFSWLGAK
jgi:hypothetical protein